MTPGSASRQLAGAEWDRPRGHPGAVRARPAGGALIVATTDWRVENMRLADGRVTAVYDWASLSLLREPVLAGSAAHAFTTNWSVDDRRQFPTFGEALAFVADYERARGAPFTDEEGAVARASLVYTMAYTARCEAPDAPTDPAPPAGTARAFLAEHGAELLGAWLSVEKRGSRSAGASGPLAYRARRARPSD